MEGHELCLAEPTVYTRSTIEINSATFWLAERTLHTVVPDPQCTLLGTHLLVIPAKVMALHAICCETCLERTGFFP